MKYRFGGRKKQLAFGSYPDVSLAEARDLGDATRKLLRASKDPADEKKRIKGEAKHAIAHWRHHCRACPRIVADADRRVAIQRVERRGG